ncbi:hypothetical protein QTP88_010544 [Uroleucon formosanum]
MTYPGLDLPLRTDESFRNQTDDDYHKEISPLVCLPINITDIVVLDYMHNVCLGVVKRLIEIWVKGNKQFSLVHLPMYVLKHGKLDNFSCFRYENYLQDLKKSIKSIKYPLQEIFNSIIENQKINNELPSQLFSQIPSLCNEIMHRILSPFFNTNDVLFEKIMLPFSNTSINIYKEKDKYIMLTNNKLVSVQHIVLSQNKPACLIVKQILSISEFTTLPLSSFKIGVYEACPKSKVSNFLAAKENFIFISWYH